jgi:DNA topoisomerase-1
MRKTVARHLRQPGLTRERVLAAILRILSTCYMRPGSEVYANENGSYGLRLSAQTRQCEGRADRV